MVEKSEGTRGHLICRGQQIAENIVLYYNGNSGKEAEENI